MSRTPSSKTGVPDGMGRPPYADGKRRIQTTVTLHPETFAWLKARQVLPEGIGAIIDRLVADQVAAEQGRP